MLVLAVGVKLDRAERAGLEVGALDRVANLGRVQRLGGIDGLGWRQQRLVSLHGVVLRVRVVTLEILGVKFLRARPGSVGQPLRDGEGVVGVLTRALGGWEFSGGEAGAR